MILVLVVSPAIVARSATSESSVTVKSITSFESDKPVIPVSWVGVPDIAPVIEPGTLAASVDTFE